MMKYYLFLLSLLAVLACSKSDNAAPANRLVGTWQLTTYCKPTSISACTTVTVPTNKSVFVTFGTDGKYTEFYENTIPADYAFLGCGSGDYQLEGSGVRIRAICMSASQGKLMKVVSVNDKQLVLNPFDTGEYLFVRK
jgi:hypothetical protein